MRILILAAGNATRWNNYLGVEKHFAPLIKEPILNRDATEDMDGPRDWDDWCYHYAQYTPQQRTQYGMTK